jgi:hypothetical protein
MRMKLRRRAFQSSQKSSEMRQRFAFSRKKARSSTIEGPGDRLSTMGRPERWMARCRAAISSRCAGRAMSSALM